VKEILTDAIGYWEPRRLLYNAALVAVVVTVFLSNLPASKGRLSFELFQVLFLQAVLANVAYCAAYVVDVVAQLSAFQSTWRRFRWMLLAIGLVFAVIITRFFALAAFARTSSPFMSP